MNRANRLGVFRTGDLTPEEVEEFMKSVEDELSDESIESEHEDDSDYNPHLDQICPEDDLAIDQHLQDAQHDTIMLARAINMSLDLSGIDLPPSASSTMHPVLSLSHEEEVQTTMYEEVDVEVETEEAQPSTSTAVETPAGVRPAKRARSPLPSMDVTGPTVTPSTGGFTGTGEFAHLINK